MGTLESIPRYAAICQYESAGKPCKFDARELKSNRNEVIFAYGRYFEFSGNSLVKSYDLKAPRACFRPEVCNPYN